MENENKKTPLPCMVCGRIDRFRLVMRNTLMDLPPYVICLECVGKVTNKYKKEDENEN